MKYKLIGFAASALMLVAVITASLLTPKADDKRYIEHIEKKAYIPCSFCDDEICTHLPIVKIDTNGKDIAGQPIITKEENFVVGYTKSDDGMTMTKATLSVVDNENKNNHSKDTGEFLGDIQVRLRGHSSRRFEKPNYLIKFINPDGTNNRQSFLGMDAHHEWNLHGPYLDESLIRNYMWYNIAGLTMEYSPNVRFCELILNGEYRGVYLATEMISAGKEGARLNLEVDKKDNTFSGYALRLDWGDGNPETLIYPYANYTKKAKSQHELVYPGAKNVTDELKKSITDDFSQFEKSLFDSKYGYKNYIDVDSFVNYFLINEISCNYDAGNLSTYIYKDVDGKYKMCVWDFNSAVDAYQEDIMPTDEFWLTDTLWFGRLFMDKSFAENVIDRYYNLRKSYFSDEYLFDFIDSTAEYLGDAIDRNYEKWEHSFEYEYDLLHPHERNARNYEETILQMKEFLKKRLQFLDENIESLRQFSTDSKTKTLN